MFRTPCIILFLSLAAYASSAPRISIDGMKCRDCMMGEDYSFLAEAIQSKVQKFETGIFWLILAKTKDGRVVAQTAEVSGKTDETQTAAVGVAEAFNFPTEFDLLVLGVNCGRKGVDRPVVVTTSPLPRAQIDTSVHELSVTFSRRMNPNGYSFVTDTKETEVQFVGSPSFSPDRKTVKIGMSLMPGRTYKVWLNSDRFTDFRDTNNVPLAPYELEFKTK